MRLLCALLLAGAAQPATIQPMLPARLTFESNAGQSAGDVRFLARAREYSVEIAANRAMIRAGNAAVQVRFLGSQPATLDGLERLPGVVNYILGSDAAHWLRHIPTFAQVRGRDLYPGVDILYYGKQGRLEYDFAVAPGVDVSRIRMKFTGAQNVRIDAQGDLVLETSAGELRQKKPVIYQENNGRRDVIDGHYRLGGNGEVSLVVASYDAKRPLVVDPEAVYAVKLPGNPYPVTAIAVDSEGNTYLSSNTAYGGNLTSRAYVVKLDPSGKKILYSTYVGGSSSSLATAIAVDATGNAYLTGTTSSSDFPVKSGVFHAAATGAFVVKLDTQGSLVYSAIVADLETQPRGIAVDGEGNAYVAGVSWGDLPVTPGAYFATPPSRMQGIISILGYDAFVLKLNAAGTSLVYATYADKAISFVSIEPATPDMRGASGVALDADGNAYITGPGWVLKFNSAGSGLIYDSPTNPAGNYDTGNAIAVDVSGNAYVAGSTDDSHAFVTKLDASGNSLFHTGKLLAGEQYDYAGGVAVDSAGNVFVGGYTLSLSFPLRSPVQESFNAEQTGFLAELDATGQLLFSTYVGDTQTFGVSGLALDPSGEPIFCGNTNLPAGINGTFSDLSLPIEAWVAKYDPSGIPALLLDSLYNLASQLGSPVSPGELIKVHGAGFGSDVQLFFDGLPATMIPGRSEAIVPYALDGKSYTFAYVESGGQKSNAVLVPVAAAAPAIFTVSGTGTGQAMVFNQDGTPNSASHPAAALSTVTFFATGVGRTVPAGVDGLFHRSTPAAVALPLTVFVNSDQARVVQANVGSVAEFPADVATVKITLPPKPIPGQASLQIAENGVASPVGVFFYVMQ